MPCWTKSIFTSEGKNQVLWSAFPSKQVTIPLRGFWYVNNICTAKLIHCYLRQRKRRHVSEKLKQKKEQKVTKIQNFFNSFRSFSSAWKPDKKAFKLYYNFLHVIFFMSNFAATFTCLAKTIYTRLQPTAPARCK